MRVEVKTKVIKPFFKYCQLLKKLSYSYIVANLSGTIRVQN
jgi:hypothetical protein